MIGSDIFTMKIAVAPGTVDSRLDSDAECEPLALPRDIGDKLRRLMKDLNLVFGAIDLRVTPEGEFVFFEINPQGQFLFVEISTGLPLSAALARYLLRNERWGLEWDPPSSCNRTGPLRCLEAFDAPQFGHCYRRCYDLQNASISTSCRP